LPKLGVCKRCHKEITELRDYSGFLVNIGEPLCGTCGPKYFDMVHRHHMEEENYLHEISPGVSNPATA